MSFGMAADPVELPDDVLEAKALSFFIPFEANSSVLKAVDTIRLFVSDDKGVSWKYEKDTIPTAAKFLFTAPRDGLYWFAVQTANKDGTRTPPAESDLVPVLKIYVNSAQLPVTRREVPTGSKQVDLINFQLQKSVPELSQAPRMNLTFVIRQPGKHIVGIDFEASKLSVTDERKTNLLGKQERRDTLTHSAHVFKDEGKIAFNIWSAILPARGAMRLKVNGLVSLRIAAEEKLIQEEGVMLKLDTPVKIGPIEITRKTPPRVVLNGKTYDDERTVVEVVYAGNIVKSIRFLDTDGKVLASKQTGHAAGGFYEHTQFTTFFALPANISRATVQVIYCNKTEIVTVPLDLSIILGF
jgi:hypothetical protein